MRDRTLVKCHNRITVPNLQNLDGTCCLPDLLHLVGTQVRLQDLLSGDTGTCSEGPDTVFAAVVLWHLYGFKARLSAFINVS